MTATQSRQSRTSIANFQIDRNAFFTDAAFAASISNLNPPYSAFQSRDYALTAPRRQTSTNVPSPKLSGHSCVILYAQIDTTTGTNPANIAPTSEIDVFLELFLKWDRCCPGIFRMVFKSWDYTRLSQNLQNHTINLYSRKGKRILESDSDCIMMYVRVGPIKKLLLKRFKLNANTEHLRMNKKTIFSQKSRYLQYKRF